MRTASESARADAAATMCAEIEHQIADLRAALYSVTDRLKDIAMEVAAGTQLISVGIGDSHLVGKLAAQVDAAWSNGMQAIAADELAAATIVSGSVALCQSISGSTSVTLTAARLLKQSGVKVVAITGEPDSPLASLADLDLTLNIPRYEPNAKVPGTITVSIPMVAVLCILEIARGALAETVIEEIACELRFALAKAKAMLDTEYGDLRIPEAAHIIGASGSAVAAYLQSKLAETVGITASISSPEEWLHVSKHAVSPGLLVVALKAGIDPLPIRAIFHETRVRDGAFAAVQGLSKLRAGGPGEVVCRLAPLLPPTRSEVFLDFAFAQQLCLQFLQQPGDWAPFQLHRLTKETVHGICRRDWRLARTDKHQVMS